MTSPKKFEALISLLEDPDREIFEHVFNELKSYGEEIIPTLETAWEESPNQILQTRLEDLIHHIQIEKLKAELIKWVKSDDLDILEGAIIISKYQYKKIDIEGIYAKIEQIRKDIWLELNDYLTAVEKIKVFNNIFYEVHKFKGDAINFLDPLHSYINSVIESKTGNSISLGILYLTIAKKLDLPIYGINLPHHFVLAYIDHDNFNLKLFEENHDEKKEVLFYINPFNEGAIFTKGEIKIYLEKLKIFPNDEGEYPTEYFEPCSEFKIIEILIDSLKKAYKNVKSMNKEEELNEILDIIKPYLSSK